MGLNTENKDKLLNVELFLSSLGKKVKGFVSKHASHNTHGHLKRSQTLEWSCKHDLEHLQTRNNE